MPSNILSFLPFSELSFINLSMSQHHSISTNHICRKKITQQLPFQ